MAGLVSWRDGPTKSAIVDFAGRITTKGPDYVAPEVRIAVFDNDGTLWVEKPALVQLDFLVRRLAEQSAADASLAEKQPYAIIAASPGVSMSMLVLHDDAEREFAYTEGAERALDLAAESGWVVASMRDEWVSVFPAPGA